VRKRKVERNERKRTQGKNPQRGQRNRMIRRVSSLFVGLFFLVTACGGEAPPPSIPSKARPSATRPRQATRVEQSTPEQKEEYTYRPAGKPDPFKPFIQLTPLKEHSKVPLTPLQKYEISQLKLVAIIALPEGNIALVEDSAGKGYFLKKGTGIGNNDGKVTKILKDKVIVEETYQDIFGQPKTHEVSLILHPTEEGGEL
jgi:type IV pilus assembly protein PilP